MGTATMESAIAKTLRRRLSISLRGMLLLVLGFALCLRQARLAEEQREAAAAFDEYGGFVRYDWEFVGGKPATGTSPPAPAWLRRAIGNDYFQEVHEVNCINATDRRGRPDLTPRESDALMAKLRAFPKLRHLMIPGELATDRAMDTIGELKDLETLKLYAPTVTAAGLAKVRALRKLKFLQVSDANLGDDALAPLAELVRLEHLDLAGNPIADAGMAHLRDLKALEFLSINRTKVSNAGLDELRGLTNLREIWVSHSAISDEQAGQLYSEMPNLHTVR